MTKIKHIEISRFRGIHSLQINDLNRVNVFLGGNNCGKSSLLEAILVMLGTSKPLLPIEMNVDRNYMGLAKEDFAMFFHNGDTAQDIRLAHQTEEGEQHELTIRYFEESINEINEEEIRGRDNSNLPLAQYGLKYCFKANSEDYSSTITYNTANGKLNMQVPETRKNGINAYYIAPRYNFNNYISHFNEIVTNKEKSAIVDILHSIEPRIKDVTVVGNKVMADAQLDKLIPINLMGDGTRKLFTIAVALYNAKDSILIVDEVDNGLYYKSMKTLWNVILQMSTTLNIQVFLSTHSIDSLEALSNLLSDEMPEQQNDVTIYTLRKNNEDDIRCYPYQYEKFNYLLDREEEIR